MSNFQVGDRVVLKRNHLAYQVGDKGAVVQVGKHGLLVRMDPVARQPPPPIRTIGPLPDNYFEADPNPPANP